MARVCIYPADCTDFSNNGMGMLTPEECTVSEIARGKYEVELVHPIDSEGRWRMIENGRYLKVSTPVRESPETDTNTAGPVVRVIYKIATPKKQKASLRTQPTTRKGAVVGKAAYDSEVIVLSRKDPDWYRVTTRNGITGYVQAEYLTYVKDEVEYPTEAGQISRRIVAPEPSRFQFFRIYSTELDTEHMRVTCQALHAVYDLRANPIVQSCDFENASARIALESCWSALQNDHPFTLHYETLQGAVTGEYTYKNMIEALLDPDSGIAVQANARVIRDNFDLYVIDDARQDHGVTIRRGKNLIGVTATTSTKDVVTRLIPVGSSAKDTDILGDPVDSDIVNDYPIPMTQVKTYKVKIGEDGIKNEAQLKAKLTELAKEDFAKDIDKPDYTLEVDFTTIPEDMYGLEYAKLNAVFMYDDVTVIDSLIGLKSKVRVVEYQWDALAERYLSIKLGDLGDVDQTVFSYNLPTGKISGTKLARNSTSGMALRDLSVSYAKMSNAAIDQLNANTIQAYRADIEKISAGEISADSLVAAIAKVTGLYVMDLNADSITTDTLAAALAKFGVITAGSAEFDRETVKHLVASALNIEDAVGEKVAIKNLVVEYASAVQANVGSLVVGASDGNFYRLDVDETGHVTASAVDVSDEEKEAGITGGGRPIIETEMNVSELFASDFKSVSALINKLDAARIDVGELTAQRAYIDHLNTADISHNQSIRVAIEAGENTARYMTFDDKGLTQRVPGSVYYTNVDNKGFSVYSTEEVRPIATMNATDGIIAQKLRLGNIRCRATSKGGWAWQYAEE